MLCWPGGLNKDATMARYSYMTPKVLLEMNSEIQQNQHIPIRIQSHTFHPNPLWRINLELKWSYAHIMFWHGFAGQGVSIRMLQWLDKARWPSKYSWKWTQKFNKLSTYKLKFKAIPFTQSQYGELTKLAICLNYIILLISVNWTVV